MPFMNRMAVVFAICLALIIFFGLVDPKTKDNPKALKVEPGMFRLSNGFIIGMLLTMGVLAALYIVYW